MRTLIAAVGIFASMVFMLFMSSSTRASVLPQTFGIAYAEGNDCAIAPDLFTKLSNIQKDTALTYDEELRAGLGARKDILRSIIDCGSKEVGTLHTNLQNTSFDDGDLLNIKTQLLSELDQANDYYTNRLARIDDLGIYGTKELAKNMREWRGGPYAVLSQRIGNLLIWQKNQALIGTSRDRLTNIKNTVTSLKLTDNDDVATPLKAAEGDMASTEDLNNQAHESIVKSNAPNDTTLLIKSSLDSLAKTYQDFFDTSDGANKILLH